MGVVKYTGPVASFHCPTNAEIRSLKVHFSPKQEGTGDPSPENVRPIVGWDGVNVYNNCKGLPNTYQEVEYIERAIEGAIITIKVNELDVASCDIYATFTILGPTSGERAYMGASNNGSAWELYFPMTVWRTNPGSTAITVSGNITALGTTSSVHVIMDDVSRGLTLGQYRYGAYQTNNRIHYCRIEKNSTVLREMIPCYRKSDNEPGMYDIITNTFYTNAGTGEFICGPDVGKTVDYEFGVLGKNKFNPNCTMITSSGIYSISNNVITQSGSDGRAWTNDSSFPPFDLLAGTYTISSSDNCIINLATSIDNYQTVYRFQNKPGTFTLEENCYVKFKCSGTYPLEHTIQIEYGDTATAYEPYDPKNTVYGGWVDLISGEVQEGIDGYPYDVIILDGTENWTLVNQNDSTTIFKYAYGGKAKTESKSICSHFKMYLVSYKNLSNPNTFVHGMSGNLFIQPANLIASTVDEFKNYLSTQYQNGTPVTILFQENKTINTYHLAPTELQTFLGQNNIWSNADYVEVEYDLHETQEILNRKAFIMANQPHLVAPEAAQLQSFTTDLTAPLKECKAYFKPKQDFNGYDRPWPAGGGKNLLNPASFVRQPGTTSGNTFEVINDTMTMTWVNGAIIANAKQQIIKAGTYTITGFGTNVDLINARISASDDYSILYTTRLTALKRTFTVEKDFYIELFGVYNNPNTAVFQLQLEAGSTATSYEPYENICPIEGWESFEATRCGKNLCNENTLLNGYIRGAVTSTGTEIGSFVSSSEWKATDFIKVLPNTIYTINFPWSNALAAGLAFYKDKTISSVISGIPAIQMGKAPYTFTTPSECNYIRFSSFKRDDMIMSLELGDIATEYEPYNGTTIPITFPTEAGTIYGGYVDLVSGEVVQTHICIDMYEFAQEHTKEILSDNLIRWRDPYGCNGSSISTHFINNPSSNWGWMATHEGHYCQWKWGYIGVSSSTFGFTTEEEWKNWFAANNVKLIGILSTPIHYTLTPTQLKTLRGTNNIWSSANDNIEIKYWKH